MATSGFIVSTLTTILFNMTCKYLQITGTTEPASVKTDKYLSWKWRNFLISFVHSTVSGLWTVFCFLNQPSLLDAAHGMLNTQSKPAYYLASFSHGYFVYDLMEMVLNLSYKGSGELVFHHLIVISCLTITIMSQQYFGYACLALMVELSNIVLHFRQLLILSGVPKKSTLYRVNCWVNIASFLLFRVLVLFWLGRSLILHHEHVPVKTFWVATFGWIVVAIMTVVLFYRLILSDFGNSSNNSSGNNGYHSKDKCNTNCNSSTSTCTNFSSSSSSTSPSPSSFSPSSSSLDAVDASCNTTSCTPIDGSFNQSSHCTHHGTSNLSSSSNSGNSASKNQLPNDATRKGAKDDDDDDEQVQNEQKSLPSNRIGHRVCPSKENEDQKVVQEGKKVQLQKEHLLNHSVKQQQQQQQQQQHGPQEQQQQQLEKRGESEKSLVSKMKNQPQVNQYKGPKYNRQQEKWNSSKEQIVVTSSKSNDSTYESKSEKEQMLQHQKTSTTRTTTSTSASTSTTSTPASTENTTRLLLILPRTSQQQPPPPTPLVARSTSTTNDDNSLHVTNAKDGSDIIRNFNSSVDFCTYNCVKEEKRTDSNNETATNNQTLQLEQCPC